MTTPVVVRIWQEDMFAIVEFQDGTLAYFEAYSEKEGSWDGLRGLTFFTMPTSMVFKYKGYEGQIGLPGRNERTILSMSDGYTQERVAEYWQAARDYLNREYDGHKPDFEKPRALGFPYQLICNYGNWELSKFKTGTARSLV